MSAANAGVLPAPFRPLPQAAPRPPWWYEDEPATLAPRPQRPHERPSGQRRIMRLLTGVAHEHGVLVGDILGPTRLAHVVRARDHATALLRWSTSLSLPAIGLIFGRDHTSVMVAIRRYEREINGEPYRRK